VPSEQVLFVMERRVSAGRNPVITLRHGRILSESKSSRLAGCNEGSSARRSIRIGLPDPTIGCEDSRALVGQSQSGERRLTKKVSRLFY
jgi:hypothetical protein